MRSSGNRSGSGVGLMLTDPFVVQRRFCSGVSPPAPPCILVLSIPLQERFI